MTLLSPIRRSQPANDVFWGEISPCEHLVQFYGDDEMFMDALQGFVLGGLQKNESVITISTESHRMALNQRLIKCGIDIGRVQWADHYIALDAEETLSKFMIGGWPDEAMFKDVVTRILHRARKNGRQVRAFGEMVALLWARGHNGATVRLEHLWHEFCHVEEFSLFCAYPKSGFTQDAASSIREICAAHSRVVGERH